VTKLSATEVRWICPPEAIPFETTADITPEGGPHMLGQERALAALKVGAEMKRPGYNLFAVGRPGIGKQTLLRAQLEKQAKAQPAPQDYAYVHDFDCAERPRVLGLPTGQGAALKRDMEEAVTTLASALRSAFESEAFRTRQKALVDAFTQRQEDALREVRERAGIRLRHRPLARQKAPRTFGVPRAARGGTAARAQGPRPCGRRAVASAAQLPRLEPRP